MSTNIVIQEGGKGYSFGLVNTLMVEGNDSEFYPWYPETDRSLDSLSVDENGIYRASDQGVYGWNHVSVNVPQSDSVTGLDPESGEEKTVTVDPETGELVETVVPVEIRITTPPTKTTYAHGETIDYSGIVVHAYSATGQDMGAVPFNELVLPETTADVQKTDEWTDGQGLNAMMLYYTPHQWFHYNPQGEIDAQGTNYVHGSALGTYDGVPATYGSDTPGTHLATRYEGMNYLALVTGSKIANMFIHAPSQIFKDYAGWVGAGGSTGGAGEGSFVAHSFSEWLTDIPVSTVDPTTVDPTNLHATQSLPVQWQRTGDGVILETSFSITVTGGN